MKHHHHDEFGLEQRRHYGADAAVVLAWVGAAAAVAGAATAAYGTYKQGEDAAAASDFNEKLAFRQADEARAAAKIKSEQQGEADRRQQAAVRARLGGAGVTEEGSPLLVLMENAATFERDQQNIKYGGELTAAGLQARGRLEGAYAGMSRTAGAVGAGSSLLGSAGRLANVYAPSRTTAKYSVEDTR